MLRRGAAQVHQGAQVYLRSIHLEKVEWEPRPTYLEMVASEGVRKGTQVSQQIGLSSKSDWAPRSICPENISHQGQPEIQIYCLVDMS